MNEETDLSNVNVLVEDIDEAIAAFQAIYGIDISN